MTTACAIPDLELFARHLRAELVIGGDTPLVPTYLLAASDEETLLDWLTRAQRITVGGPVICFEVDGHTGNMSADLWEELKNNLLERAADESYYRWWLAECERCSAVRLNLLRQPPPSRYTVITDGINLS